MTREEANHLVEGDRVTTRRLRGTVVGVTENCVSIQWDGREATEIFMTDDMRNISKEGQKK
jgi:preprotein translocase subunit YajC